jgi:hypothetical protein
VANWLEVDLKITSPFDLNEPETKKYMDLLEGLLKKPEFFPFYCYEGSKYYEENLIRQISKFYFISSLCESEPKRFKYVFQLPYRTQQKDSYLIHIPKNLIVKNKFDILDEGKCQTNNKSTGGPVCFDSYEIFKREVCEKGYETVKLDTISFPHILKSNGLRPFNIVNIPFHKYFSPSQKLLIQTSDDFKLHFSYDLLSLWSETISNCIKDIQIDNSNDEHYSYTPNLLRHYQIIIPFTKRIFILYCIYRITNYNKLDLVFGITDTIQKSLTVLDETFNFQNYKEFFDNYEELYKMADYLEDAEMIHWIIRGFNYINTNIYQKQRFLELIKF